MNATIRGALPDSTSTENEAEGGTAVGVGVGVGVAVGVAVGVGTGLGFGTDVGVAVGSGAGREVVAAVGATPSSGLVVGVGAGVGAAQAKPMVARRANNPKKRYFRIHATRSRRSSSTELRSTSATIAPPENPPAPLLKGTGGSWSPGDEGRPSQGYPRA